jgi:hypothetical protein
MAMHLVSVGCADQAKRGSDNYCFKCNYNDFGILDNATTVPGAQIYFFIFEYKYLNYCFIVFFVYAGPVQSAVIDHHNRRSGPHC